MPHPRVVHFPRFRPNAAGLCVKMTAVCFATPPLNGEIFQFSNALKRVTCPVCKMGAALNRQQKQNQAALRLCKENRRKNNANNAR